MRGAKTLVIVALLLSAGLAALAPGAHSASTTTLQPQLPVPLVGAASVHLDGATYIFGGRNANNEYSSDIQRFDHGTGKIVKVASFQDAGPNHGGRYAGAAVPLNGKIYYFGGAVLVSADVNGDGQNENIPKASRDIFEFNPATNSLRHLSLEKMPLPAWGISGAAANGKIWLFGGFTFDISDLPSTQRHKWVLRFDPAANEGAKVTRLGTELPYRVQDAAVAWMDNRIYVMAGLSDHDNNTNPCPTYQTYNSETGEQETRQTEVCLTRKIVSFDPTTQLVRGVAGELPYRVQFASAAVLNDKAYVPGGLLNDGTAAASIVEVTPTADGRVSSTLITPVLPQGLFGQGVVSDGSVVYTFGGRFGKDSDLTSQIVQIDPRPSVAWAPRSATASAIQSGVRLAWEPPAYDGGSVVTGYRVYRTDAATGTESLLTTTAQLVHDDLTVKPGREYQWRITAINAIGESATSATVGRSADATTPGAVASFQAYPGNQEVLLRWNAPTETGGSNITGYRVYRDGQLLTTVGPSVFEHLDTGLVNEQTYAYVVKAYNAKGDGAASSTRRVAPAPVPSAPTGVTAQPSADDTSSSVTLTWIPPPQAVERFVIVRGVAPGVGEVVGEVQSDTTSFVDTLVERGQTYYYSVKTANSAGESPPSEEISVSLVRKPGAPQKVQAIGLEGQVRVTWQAPTDTGDAPAENLRYYVSRTGGGSSRSIIVETDIKGTIYTDRTVTPGQSYTYTVTTLNPQASAASAPATATPIALQSKPPVAVLAALPSVTSAGDPVQLDASQSKDEDGSIRHYLFDFGDGTEPVRSSVPTVTHAYVTNGTYTATVVVTDDHEEVSEPATTRIVVGEIVSTSPPDSGLGNLPGSGLGGKTPAGRVDGAGQPGTQMPKIPGPALGLVLLALAGVALTVSRRNRSQ